MLTKTERQKAQTNKTSRKKAIELQCRDCIFDPSEAGTWRKQAEECPARGCPLWNFRFWSINARFWGSERRSLTAEGVEGIEKAMAGKTV